MNIIIKTLSNDKYKVTIDQVDTATVTTLKEKISVQKDVSVDSIKLVFNGHILKDSDTLQQCKIVNNSIVIIVAKKVIAKPSPPVRTGNDQNTPVTNTDVIDRNFVPLNPIPELAGSDDDNQDNQDNQDDLPELDNYDLHVDDNDPNNNNIQDLLNNMMAQFNVDQFINILGQANIQNAPANRNPDPNIIGPAIVDAPVDPNQRINPLDPNFRQNMIDNPDRFREYVMNIPGINQIIEHDPDRFEPMFTNPAFIIQIIDQAQIMTGMMRGGGAGGGAGGGGFNIEDAVIAAPRNNFMFARDGIFRLGALPQNQNITAEEQNDINTLIGLGVSNQEAIYYYRSCDNNMNLAANMIIEDQADRENRNRNNQNNLANILPVEFGDNDEEDADDHPHNHDNGDSDSEATNEE